MNNSTGRMNTKLQFKLIGLLIICSITGVTILQGYWLKGLYDSTWQQTQRSIEEVLRRADYKELFLRMEEEKLSVIDVGNDRSHFIQNEDSTYSYNRTFQYSLLDQLSGRRDTSNDRNNKVKIVVTEEHIDSKTISETVDEYFQVMDQLEEFTLFAMHQDLDTILPVNYARFDSLLFHELKNIDISIPYVLELRSDQEDSSILLNRYETRQDFTKDTVVFDYPIQASDQFYRVTFKSTNRIILKKMSGILLSSFLLLLLVIIAFVYLLRTILRQKTMEELKTDFTNNVTHELKTPLAVAYAANDALLNYDNTLTDKQKKYLQIIQDQIHRLTGMVEQILTLSMENRTSFKLNLTEVEVASLLPALIEQQKLKTKKEVRILSGLPEGFTIRADRNHLFNMIHNLIENAIKYSGKEPVKIRISGTRNEDEILLSVQDNGIGISEIHQVHIFEKFYRVPQGNLHNVKGYGLGLYYIKDMMAKHGGSVRVKSQLGKGSVFTLHFTQK
ncbi:MAG: HAMP domain-containing histidine kinase [Tannerellaceae bacterium]|nr:HAMP domain-containing histidine kinase [Tannerellaceae bacterium]